jgi:hypothetical protein
MEREKATPVDESPHVGETLPSVRDNPIPAGKPNGTERQQGGSVYRSEGTCLHTEFGTVSSPVDEAAINQNPAQQASGSSPTGRILPVVIVCAHYRFEGSTKDYQTHGAFNLAHLNGGDSSFDVGKDMPVELLYFSNIGGNVK